MERLNEINYFFSKEECENFLSRFKFKYYIPELIGNFKYCIKLTNDLKNLYWCGVECDGIIIDVFFDMNQEYIIKKGSKYRNFMLKEEGENFHNEIIEMATLFQKCV